MLTATIKSMRDDLQYMLEFPFEQGAAMKSGRIKPGELLMSVDGRSVDELAPSEGVDVTVTVVRLMNGRCAVVLRVIFTTWMCMRLTALSLLLVGIPYNLAFSNKSRISVTTPRW